MTDNHEARIMAMQALCQLEALDDHFTPQLDEFLAEQTDDEDLLAIARSLTLDAWQDRETLDGLIREVAEHWDLERMAAVDRNVIRVAVCELLHRPKVPPRVAINEAVEIGKVFGAAESAGFINGILDAVLKKTTRSQGKGKKKDG